MKYDVLLFGANIADKANGIKKVNDLIYKVSCGLTSTGYIVNKHYFDTLIDNYRESVKLLINYRDLDIGCIDINWLKLQNRDNWYILFPRTITQRPARSLIQNNYVDYTHLFID
jgi:glycosyl transferase family 25